MYGHGFATLFLGEIYGMTHDDTVKEKLERAVRLIERSQNPEGGWRYQPVPADATFRSRSARSWPSAAPARRASKSIRA